MDVLDGLILEKSQLDARFLNGEEEEDSIDLAHHMQTQLERVQRFEQAYIVVLYPLLGVQESLSILQYLHFWWSRNLIPETLPAPTIKQTNEYSRGSAYRCDVPQRNRVDTSNENTFGQIAIL